MKALISVVTPCFNGAAYVEEAVESALGQTYPDVEMIVVDDGSTDGTAGILGRLAARHGGRLRVLGGGHEGQYAARNRGLSEARGELIAFLDADDYWRADALSLLATALCDHDADVAYCGNQIVGEGLRVPPYVPPAYEAADPVDAFLWSCPWAVHAALTRKAVLARVGGFGEEAHVAMDYDLWLKVLAVTRRFVRVPEALAFYRQHDGPQVSRPKWREALAGCAARHAFARAHPELLAHLTPEQRRELVAGSLRREALLALWRRDLDTAHHLLRELLRRGGYHGRDVVHLAAALLPLPAFTGIVTLKDRVRRAIGGPGGRSG